MKEMNSNSGNFGECFRYHGEKSRCWIQDRDHWKDNGNAYSGITAKLNQRNKSEDVEISGTCDLV